MQLEAGEPLQQIMLARYYGNGLPRFLSPDPIGGTVKSPQSWNRYAYVLGNPMKLVDPTGMYGINHNPYNPEGTNPCDGKGPMCFKVEGGNPDEQKKVKGALEETRKHLTAETTKYFEDKYGADIDEIFTDGSGPTLKLEHNGTNTRTARGKYDKRHNTVHLNLDYFEYGENNQLFGSVTASDVAAAVQAQAGIELDRRKLIMPDAIKTLGEYSVTAKLHSDVEFPFTIEVVKA